MPCLEMKELEASCNRYAERRLLSISQEVERRKVVARKPNFRSCSHGIRDAGTSTKLHFMPSGQLSSLEADPEVRHAHMRPPSQIAACIVNFRMERP